MSKSMRKSVSKYNMTDESVRECLSNALQWIVTGNGRKRCPDDVYSSAHYALAMLIEDIRADKEAGK